MLKPLAWMGLFLTFSASAYLWLSGRHYAAYGAWVGAIWMFLNLFVLLHLVRMSLSGASPDSQKRVFALTLVKFPVLYLAGFMVLRYRLFPVRGIVIGLTAVMVAFTFAWMKAVFAREGRTA